MTPDLESFELPAHWASSLINGNMSGLSVRNRRQLDDFESMMLKEYGSCQIVNCSDEPYFLRYHDAYMFGVLACDVLKMTFDVTKRADS